ncbi:hypothetical protein Q9251_08190 [Alkalihalobacillus macyae]|uniref:hypothetical protein n=1 Tax=Guptibacillus hwajinpoensis TaxID=208199 RepID=UPI00273CB7EE|nr:hypothetical protein [Alkalihalobacillus macyae]MDP4550862.1 hypothetical protein [Alkalihalobacillus macyae]
MFIQTFWVNEWIGGSLSQKIEAYYDKNGNLQYIWPELIEDEDTEEVKDREEEK